VSRQGDLVAARRWAAALDADEFALLPALLSPDCRYHSPSGVLEGPGDIVASYEGSSVWARATFDAIRWESECVGVGDRQVLITFTDITDHQGRHHVYRCQQLVDLDEDGLIARIEHRPIEAEETALAAFFDDVGVERPSGDA
jgi:SnoaL-like domain